MTDIEIINLLEELHGAGLANEPRDTAQTVRIWRDFFGGDDARVIGKAVYILLKIKKTHFWPTPGDVESVKTRAEWLIDMEDEQLRDQQRNAIGGDNNTIKKLNTESHTPPTAPALFIKPTPDTGTICDICELCNTRDQDHCPYDY